MAMGGGAGVQARRRVPTVVWDVVVTVVVLLPAVHLLFGFGSILGAVVTVVPAVVLWWRRRWPVPVLIVCVGCFAVAVFSTPFSPGTVLAVAVAMYAYAVSASRVSVVVAAIAVLVAVLPVSAVAVGVVGIEPLPMLVAVSVGFAAALGDNVRTRRAYIAEITARAVHAEATRESEAARRVSEERLRIAQDLHDVVAHQITVISLHTGVASAQLATDPEGARASLATVRSASRRVLSDIGDLLAVLRSTQDSPGEPQPTLQQLPDLVADFARSGLDVTVRQDDGLPELPPAVDVVAYRILQEALTNALRHGSEARAHVRLGGAPGALVITVTNPVDELANLSGGHGLQGIRERAETVRGQVEISPLPGVFRLRVTLPVREEP